MNTNTNTCTGCGAPLEFTENEKFLTCEFCGTQHSNPHYDENAPVIRTRKSDDADAVLSAVCGAATITAKDCSFGTPITGGKRLSRARKYFNIPDEDNVYMIYDSTLLGSCKEGFALCSSGFYCCIDGTGYLSWDDFIQANIPLEGSVNVNEYTFITATDTGKLLSAFLQKLQNRL